MPLSSGFRASCAHECLMKIRIWGARGSIPTPLQPEEVQEKIRRAILKLPPTLDTSDSQAVDYYLRQLPILERQTAGGNTSCVEINADDRCFIVDGGSGIRSLGNKLMCGSCGRGTGTVHLFLSHFHWDHIQGIPFFPPAYIKGNVINVYSVFDAYRVLTRQQSPPNFPVDWQTMSATFHFHKLPTDQVVTIDGLKISAIRNTHPGVSYSYRFEDEYSAFVYAHDSEHKDPNSAFSQKHVEFFERADALMFDAQYTLSEAWQQKEDWGHSSALVAVDLAQRAGVKKLLLSHHDPSYSDERLMQIQKDALLYRDQQDGTMQCDIQIAREGLELDLTPSGAVHIRIADNQTSIVTPRGIFDAASVENISSLLHTPNNGGAALIDLSRIETLSTSGLRALLSFRRARSTDLMLIAPPQSVLRVLELSGYSDLLAIYPSEEAAQEALSVRESIDLPGQVVLNRYLILEKLGSADVSAVIKARDLRSRRIVALKVLPMHEPSPFTEVLITQAHRMHKLHHSNLVNVLNVEETAKFALLVEEFIDQKTLQSLFDENTLLRPNLALNIALSLLDALEYIHAQGMIHGNLKPQTIFLSFTSAQADTEDTSNTSSISVKVGGFGAHVFDGGSNLLDAPLLLSATAYLAPEQIAGEALDHRADLYVLGVLFYRLFTGALPFNQSTARDMMRAHLEQSPVSPTAHNRYLSPLLGHLILKLLEKDPSRRYDSASEIRSVLQSLVLYSTLKPAVDCGRLIGRREACNTLRMTNKQAQAGAGQVMVISGAAGMGKSTLASAAGDHSRVTHCFSGMCVQSKGDVPYRPWVEILSAYLDQHALNEMCNGTEANGAGESQNEAATAGIDEEMRTICANLLLILPQLNELIPGLILPPSLSPADERTRIIKSAIRFIERATAKCAWIVTICDTQRIDQSSLELLIHLQERIPSMRLLLLPLVDRDEISAKSSVNVAVSEAIAHMSQLPNFEQIDVKPLTMEQTAQLINQQLKGESSVALIENIFKRTAGNPFYTNELLKGLRGDGLGREELNQLDAVDYTQLLGTLDETIRRRIHHVNPDTQALLWQACVLGSTFKLEHLRAMSELPLPTLLTQLDAALAFDLLREGRREGTLCFCHRRMQEVIYNDLGTLQRQQIHLLAARALEKSTISERALLNSFYTSAIAHHYSKANCVKEGIAYALQAARHAEQLYANQDALYWYTRILHLVDGEVDESESVPLSPETADEVLAAQLRLSRLLIESPFENFLRER